jgi:hypothetical protein
MNAGMMLLSAEAFFAVINVVAPAAMIQAIFFANRAADGAAFVQVGDNVKGNCPPVFHHFLFFPNLGELFFVHRAPPPFSSIIRCKLMTNRVNAFKITPDPAKPRAFNG